MGIVYKQVVRALSFSARTEDGRVVAAAGAGDGGDVLRPVKGRDSFTSIDLKKARRVANRLSVPSKPAENSAMPSEHPVPTSTMVSASKGNCSYGS